MRWCVEGILHDRGIEPLSFTALGSRARWNALRHAATERRSCGDTRHRRATNSPTPWTTFATGLTLPNGLAYYDGEYLYVSGGAQHLSDFDRRALLMLSSTICRAGTGFWTGGLAIRSGGRLYVAVGAPCGNCEFDERERGAILSMNLDGSDRQIVATGFRQPADVAFYRDRLWTLDSAPHAEGPSRAR